MNRLRAASSVWLLLCVMIACWSGEVSASWLVNQPVVPPPSEKETVSDKETAKKGLPFRRTYIPESELEALLADGNKGVLMPQPAFRKLYEKAERARIAAANGPRGIVVSDVLYRGRVQNEQLLITAEIRFRQFADGWRQLALPFRRLHVERATLDGQPAVLGRSSSLLFLHQKKGRFTLSLEFSVPLHRAGGDRVASFELMEHPVASFQMALPAGKFLGVDQSLLKRPVADNAAATYRFSVGRRRSMTLRITDGKRLRPTDDLLLATTNMAIAVSAAHGDWRAETVVESIGKRRDRLELTVSGLLKISSVSAAGLGSWQWIPGDDAESPSIVRLHFRREFSGARTVRLRGLFAIPADGFWSVPTVVLKDATSHIGRLTIGRSPTVRLRVDEHSGVQLLSAEAAKGSVKKIAVPKMGASILPALSFRLWEEDFSLSLASQLQRVEFRAETTAKITVSAKHVELVYGAEIRNVNLQGGRYRPPSDLQVSLPTDWVVQKITVNGKPVRWTSPRQAVDQQLLHILLPEERRELPPVWGKGGQGKSSGFKSDNTDAEKNAHSKKIVPIEKTVVEITARRGFEVSQTDQTSAFSIPKIRLLQMNSVRGTILIFADDALETVPQKLVGLLRVPQKSLVYRYRMSPSKEEGGESEAWYSGVLKVVRRPGQLVVRTVTYSRLDPSALRSHIVAECQIHHGGMTQFSVTLPEWVGAGIRFRWYSASGRLIEQVSQAARKGRRIWTLKFDRRMTGVGLLVVALETERAVFSGKEFVDQLPLKKGTGNGDFRGYLLHDLQFPTAERQNGFVAIEAEGDQRLRMNAVALGNAADQISDSLLGEIDPVELPVLRLDSSEVEQPLSYRPRQRIVAAYRYLQPRYRILLTEERLAVSEIPLAICRENRLQSVLSATGEFEHRAIYRILTETVRGVRIVLPEGAELWAAMVDHKPMEVRRERDGFYVSLGQSFSGEADEAEHDGDDSSGLPRGKIVELFYRTTVDIPNGVGRIQQQSPIVFVVHGTGQEQPLEILERDWTLYTPSEMLLVGSRGRFEAVDSQSRSSVLLRLLNDSVLESPDQFLPRIANTLLLLGGILLLFAAWYRYRFAGLAVVGGGLFVVCLALLIPVLSMMTSKGNRGMDSMEEGASYSSKSSAAQETSAEKTMAPSAKPVPSKSSELAKKSESPKSSEPRRSKAEKSEKFIGALTEVERSAIPFFKEKLKGDKLRDLRGKDELLNTLSLVIRDSALLSVAATFEPPAHYTESRFLYRGEGFDAAENDAAASHLDLVSENREHGMMLRICIAFGVTLLFWWFRRRAIRFRGLLAIAGVSLPAMLLVVTPILWHVLLDGLFLGALGGCLLWFLLSLPELFAVAWKLFAAFWAGDWLEEQLGKKKTKAGTKTAMTILFLCGLSGAAMAQPVSIQPNFSPSVSSPSSSPSVSLPLTKLSEPKTIVIPYDPNKKLQQADRVFVPYQEFRRLWDLANPSGVAAVSPKMEGLVLDAMHVGRVQVVKKNGAGKTGQFVVMKSRILFFSFRKQQITLPVPLGKIAIQKALLDGQPAPLVMRQNNRGLQKNGENQQPGNQQAANRAARNRKQFVGAPQLSLPMTGLGLHILDLEYAIPVQQQGVGGKISLPLRAVASGRFSLQLPKSGLAIRVNGSTGAFRRRALSGKKPEAAGKKPAEKTGGETIEFAVDRGGVVQVQWQPPGKRSVEKPIVHARIQTDLNLDRRGATIRSQLLFDVRRGRLNEIRFTIPKGYRFLRMDGSEISGWEQKRVDGKNRIRLFLRRAVTKQTEITVLLSKPMSFGDEANELTVTPIELPDATHQTETVRVMAKPYLRVRVTKTLHYSQINSAGHSSRDLRAGLETSQFVFQSTKRGRQLQLRVMRPVAKSSGAFFHRVVVGRQRVKIISELTIDLRDDYRSSLTMFLPDGFSLESVLGDHLAGTSTGEDAGTLFVAFKTPQTGRIRLTLSGTFLRTSEKPSVEISFPSVILLEKMTSRVAIWTVPGLHATAKNVSGWKSLTHRQLLEMIRTVNKKAVYKTTTASKKVALPTLGLTSEEEEPEAITVALSVVEPAVSVEAITFITVTDIAVQQLIAVKWSGLHSGPNRVAMTGPAWLADQLDFGSNHNLRVRCVKKTKLPNGRVRWIIESPGSSGTSALDAVLLPQNSSTTGIFIIPKAFLPAPQQAGNRVRAPVLSFEIQKWDAAAKNGAAPVFVSLNQQSHIAVLTNHSSQQLTAEKPESLVPFLKKELPQSIKLPKEMVVIPLFNQSIARIRIASTAAEPVWKLHKFSVQRGAAAVVQRADLLTLVENNGTWRCRAIYRMKNRTRQFLAVQLPKNSRVLSVVVNGYPSRVVQQRAGEKQAGGQTASTVYSLIPIPKAGDANLPFSVRLILSGVLPNGALPRGLKVRSTPIDLPVPHVVSSEQNDALGIPVLQTLWTVHFPDGYNAAAITDNKITNVTVIPDADKSDDRHKQIDALFRILENPNISSRKRYLAWKTLTTLQQQKGYQKFSSPFSERRSDENSEITYRLQQMAPNLKINERQKELTLADELLSANQALDEKQSRQNLMQQQKAIQAWNSSTPPADDSYAVPPSKKLPQPQMAIPKPGVKEADEDDYYRDGDEFDKEDETIKGMKSSVGLLRGLRSVEFDFTIPEGGQTLQFKKAGGAPKLQLAVRNERSWDSAQKLIWFLGWALFGGGFFWVFWKTSSFDWLRKNCRWLLFTVGLLMACFLPIPLSFVGFLMSVIIGVQWARCRFSVLPTSELKN